MFYIEKMLLAFIKRLVFINIRKQLINSAKLMGNTDFICKRLAQVLLIFINSLVFHSYTFEFSVLTAGSGKEVFP